MRLLGCRWLVCDESQLEKSEIDTQFKPKIAFQTFVPQELEPAIGEKEAALVELSEWLCY